MSDTEKQRLKQLQASGITAIDALAQLQKEGYTVSKQEVFAVWNQL